MKRTGRSSGPADATENRQLLHPPHDDRPRLRDHHAHVSGGSLSTQCGCTKIEEAAGRLHHLEPTLYRSQSTSSLDLERSPQFPFVWLSLSEDITSFRSA